jgi:glutathione gamma-glutamylcysteinyltransferase
MLTDSFYRRPLPDRVIPFSSPEGRRLFREALAAGTLEGYFPLAEQFHTQAEPAFCGLGTLVIVLNALAIDPGRLWRGPWRWYSEELLDCCRPLEVVRREGLTLEDLACLARCNGASAELRRPPAASIEDLRRDLAQAAAAPEGRHLVLGYDRAVLGQTGGGHYSPLGGYHAGRDLALLLDVARFKYPPHWVPVPLLSEAMQPADPATGRPRGYVVLGRAAASGRVLGCVSCHDDSFADVRRRLREALPAALEAAAPASVSEAVATLLGSLPEEAAGLIELSIDPGALGDPGALAAPEPRHRALVAEMVKGLRQLALFDLVEEALAGPAKDGPAVRRWLAAGATSALAERATLLLTVLPEDLLRPLSREVREHFEALRASWAWPPALRAEVEGLRAQLDALEGRCCAS